VWNGGSLTNAVNPAVVNTTGNYTATVTNPLNGCTSQSVITVAQNTNSPNVTISSPSTTLTCLQTNIVLTGSSTTSGVLFSWTSPLNVSNATANITSPGNYTLVVTNPVNGCTSSSVVAITQNTVVPNVSAGPNQTITCAVSSVTLNGSSTTAGATFTWTPLNVNSSTTTVNTPGNYTLTVTDPLNGCVNSSVVVVAQNGSVPNVTAGSSNSLNCNFTSAVLSGTSTTSGVIYSWTGGPFNSPNYTVTTPGTYTLTVFDPFNSCSTTTVISILQNTLQPNLTAVSSNSLNCLLNTSTLTASSSNTSVVFVWNGGSLSNAVNPVSVSVPANYSVTATDPVNGCTSTSVVTVLQNTNTPIVTASTSNQLNCNNTSAVLTATSTTGGLTYQWTAGPSQPSYTVNQAGTYTVTVTNPSNGCSNTAIVSVTASPMFTANISVLSQINCFGANNGALQVNVNGGSMPFTITNLNNNNTLSNISTFPVTLNNLSAGNYSIEVSDANGCKQTLYSSISQPSPLNVLVAGNSSLCAGSSASLTSNVSGGTAPYNFQWSPNGGTSPNTVVSPVESTVYTLTVNDTKSNGY